MPPQPVGWEQAPPYTEYFVFANTNPFQKNKEAFCPKRAKSLLNSAFIILNSAFKSARRLPMQAPDRFVLPPCRVPRMNNPVCQGGVLCRSLCVLYFRFCRKWADRAACSPCGKGGLQEVIVGSKNEASRTRQDNLVKPLRPRRGRSQRTARPRRCRQCGRTHRHRRW